MTLTCHESPYTSRVNYYTRLDYDDKNDTTVAGSNPVFLACIDNIYEIYNIQYNYIFYNNNIIVYFYTNITIYNIQYTIYNAYKKA